MTDPLQSMKDAISIAATGMTKTEAIAKGICVKCRMAWRQRTHSDDAKREYHISGYCEECWNELFKEIQAGD